MCWYNINYAETLCLTTFALAERNERSGPQPRAKLERRPLIAVKQPCGESRSEQLHIYSLRIISFVKRTKVALKERNERSGPQPRAKLERRPLVVVKQPFGESRFEQLHIYSWRIIEAVITRRS